MGLLLTCIGFELRCLWREWDWLQAEWSWVRRTGVIGYPNICPPHLVRTAARELAPSRRGIHLLVGGLGFPRRSSLVPGRQRRPE